MKTRKRLLSALLAAVMLMCCVRFPAAAAEGDIELTVLNVQKMQAGQYDPDAASLPAEEAANPGDILVLTLGARNNTDTRAEFDSFSLFLSYDRSKVSLYSGFEDSPFNGRIYVKGSGLSDWGAPTVNQEAEDYVSFVGASTETASIPARGTIVLIQAAFQVNSGASGSAAFQYDSSQHNDLSHGYDALSLDLKGRSVLVGTQTTPDFELAVLKAQKMTPGTYSASAESVRSVQPGDVVVLTLGARNHTATAAGFNNFSAFLNYDTGKVSLYSGFADAPFSGRVYAKGGGISDWGLPTVNEAETFISFAGASADAVSIPSEGELELVLTAFQVKEGASGDLAFSFADDQHNDVSLDFDSLNPAYKGLTLTIGAGTGSDGTGSDGTGSDGTGSDGTGTGKDTGDLLFSILNAQKVERGTYRANSPSVTEAVPGDVVVLTVGLENREETPVSVNRFTVFTGYESGKVSPFTLSGTPFSGNPYAPHSGLSGNWTDSGSDYQSAYVKASFSGAAESVVPAKTESGNGTLPVALLAFQVQEGAAGTAAFTVLPEQSNEAVSGETTLTAIPGSSLTLTLTEAPDIGDSDAQELDYLELDMNDDPDMPGRYLAEIDGDAEKSLTAFATAKDTSDAEIAPDQLLWTVYPDGGGVDISNDTGTEGVVTIRGDAVDGDYKIRAAPKDQNGHVFGNQKEVDLRVRNTAVRITLNNVRLEFGEESGGRLVVALDRTGEELKAQASAYDEAGALIPDGGVSWTLSPINKGVTIDPATGLITIALDADDMEPYTITATPVEGSGIWGTAAEGTLTIQDETPQSELTGVELDRDRVILTGRGSGETIRASGKITGNQDVPPTELSWWVTDKAGNEVDVSIIRASEDGTITIYQSAEPGEYSVWASPAPSSRTVIGSPVSTAFTIEKDTSPEIVLVELKTRTTSGEIYLTVSDQEQHSEIWAVCLVNNQDTRYNDEGLNWVVTPSDGAVRVEKAESGTMMVTVPPDAVPGRYAVNAYPAPDSGITGQADPVYVIVSGPTAQQPVLTAVSLSAYQAEVPESGTDPVEVKATAMSGETVYTGELQWTITGPDERAGILPNSDGTAVISLIPGITVGEYTVTATPAGGAAPVSMPLTVQRPSERPASDGAPASDGTSAVPSDGSFTLEADTVSSLVESSGRAEALKLDYSDTKVEGLSPETQVLKTDRDAMVEKAAALNLTGNVRTIIRVEVNPLSYNSTTEGKRTLNLDVSLRYTILDASGRPAANGTGTLSALTGPVTIRLNIPAGFTPRFAVHPHGDTTEYLRVNVSEASSGHRVAVWQQSSFSPVTLSEDAEVSITYRFSNNTTQRQTYHFSDLSGGTVALPVDSTRADATHSGRWSVLGTEYSSVTENLLYAAVGKTEVIATPVGFTTNTPVSYGGGGGGGGGSSSRSTTYTVTVNQNPNGTAAASTRSARSGATVTLTISPNPGYRLDTLSVKDAGGNTVTTAAGQNGQYTFVMPSSNVTVSATFTTGTGTGGSSGYRVVLTETQNGRITANPTVAASGSMVTITATPNTGFELDNLTVTDDTGAGIPLTRQQDGMFTFTMPSSNVRVAASFIRSTRTNPFIDVYESSPFYDAIMWACFNGITNGTTYNMFSPDRIANRANAVTFLWRAAGSPEPRSANSPFTDVPREEYYYKAVQWAVEQGITTGRTNTTFVPEDPVTRGNVVTFLFRRSGAPAPSAGTVFPDVPEDMYYYNPVRWGSNVGIARGFEDGYFRAEEYCTRAQLVTFLYRYVNRPAF